jgi:diguanylate cyclase (GGDEF)-like protein/PAS domain S-box-containing protein
MHLTCFIAVFGALSITAITLHPLRAATLAYAAALAAMVAIKAGMDAPTAMAGLALLCLAIATWRLAIFDATQSARRRNSDDGGRLAQLLLREYEDHGAGWFWQTDRNGNITYLSRKVARDIAEANGDPIGRRLNAVFRMEEDTAGTERTLNFHLSSRTSFSEYSVRLAGDATAERWLSISGSPIADDLGRFLGFVGSGADLTEKRRSEAEITKLALFDGLTGLANRQRMRTALDKLLAPPHGARRPAGLLLLDLDRFKAVNDTLGHQVGDVLLKQVAQRLQRVVGESGLIGRLGGDEFQVVLPDEVNRDLLGELARSIIASLSQPYFIEGSSITIGCSIGIAIAPEDGRDTETLIRNADLALYAAKAEGRGVHRFYKEELLVGAQSRKLLEDDLRQALAQNQLHVAYQPVVSTMTEEIVGYEALVRWTHPTRGAISPAEFVPVAEECGLIESIGEWVLRTACNEAARWPRAVRVAVNLSPIQFANPALPAIVTNVLAQSGLAPSRLELEITEGVFLNESAAADAMFASLKRIGVRLALDDFGTGYSSLGYLKKAPFDKIKIDQSFVRGAAIPGNRNAAIIKAIVSLADTLGMETTAEGVELQDEIALIRELGCSHIQGYVYGKAAPCETVVEQLSTGGGQASALGHKSSRAPRSTMLRSATLDLGNARGEVRIRNISSTGVLIDGIEFPGDPNGVDVLIELLEGQMFAGILRWARDGRAGIELNKPFNLDRLNQPAQRPALRRRA